MENWVKHCEVTQFAIAAACNQSWHTVQVRSMKWDDLCECYFSVSR